MKGFSLVEALVVVAIVAILGLSITSAFASAKAEEECKSNIMASCSADGKPDYECMAISSEVCEDDTVVVYNY